MEKQRDTKRTDKMGITSTIMGRGVTTISGPTSRGGVHTTVKEGIPTNRQPLHENGKE